MDWTALRVSLSLGLWTVALLLPAGTWAGHQLATRQFRGKPILEALVAIPLILPPTVLGFYLLTVFSHGRRWALRLRASWETRWRFRSQGLSWIPRS